ncbi:MAG: AAA family ATPase [Bacteroidales bacterium]|nr:AAA family ATPase [Bacteroidales bacterium]
MNGRHEEMQGYPLGQQDFKEIREQKLVYIDKTMFIDKILKRKIQYLFLARPRRFGKSLFLSTLRYFFEGRRELFDGLYIASTGWDWTRYPVLHLDLNPERFSEPRHLDRLLEAHFRVWEKQYEVEVTAPGYPQRFRNIIKAAHDKTGKKVVILVDEYDKPLVSNLDRRESLDLFRTLLAAIYSNFKSSAEHIRFVMLTGVSRFSKLSVFSDLNNLDDVTFDDDFADICGITEEELLDYFPTGIQQFAATQKVSYEEACAKLKVNYDGYRFARVGSDIYNPWSLLSCMRKSRLGNYWNQTGIPTIIAKTLRDLDSDLEKILNTRCKFSQLAGLDLSSIDPLALLYQTGYLTIKKFNQRNDTVTLGVPNKEVKEGLFDVLLPFYVKVRRGTPESVVRDIINSIRDGEPEELMKNLDIFLAGIPYDMRMDDENNFQNAMYVLLTLIGIDAKTEVHTSSGRIDVVIEDEEYIYIIELKFDKDSQSALSQIGEKEYDLPFHRGCRTIFRIGVNFNKATRHLDKPMIEIVSPGR